MRHGRDHEEREQKVGQSRTNNTPEADSFEAQMLNGGRHGGTPNQYVVGAHTERIAPASELEEEEPRGGGSDVAPTKLAEERERERHKEERKIGRLAAGVGENPRDKREPGVTREDLDEAARKADEKVLGSQPTGAPPRRES